MRERDIHNLIEQQNPEAKQEIWEKICSQIDVSEMQPKQEVAAKPKRWKLATIALAVICVVTLAIVLPLTLNTDDGVRFCDITQYETKSSEKTLQEYFSEHNRDFLYIDWYESAEEVTTSYAHIIDAPNNIVFYKEVILNGDTGEEITLSITDNKTRVDIFEMYYQDYEEMMVNGIAVNWRSYSLSNTIAMFEYQKHIYYLQIDVGNAKDRLREIITDMIRYT